MNKIQIILIASCLLFFLLVIQLTRKRKIQVKYSLIWLICSAVLLFFSIFKGLFDHLAHAMGIVYAPSLILVVLVFLGLILGIHLSIVVSKISDDNRKLIQEIGLLKQRFDQLTKNDH